MGAQARTRDLDKLIAWVADRQRGVVAHWQLKDWGVSNTAIDRRIRKGLLIPIFRGVYAVGHRASVPLQREAAAVLAYRHHVALSHRTSAAMMELLPYPASADVWVTVAQRRVDGRPGLCVMCVDGFDPRDIRRLDGLPITAPARTLVDLASVVDAEQLERAVATGLRGERWATEREVWEQLARDRGRRGAGRLGALLERDAEPAHTKSEAEALLLGIIREAGFPEPRANMDIGPYEVDLAWPSHHVIAEYDSWQFHSDRTAFRPDRERTNWLQLRGYVVLRFTWYDVTRGRAALLTRLRQALRLHERGINPA